MELTDKELELCLKALVARTHYINLLNKGRKLPEITQKALDETHDLKQKLYEYFGMD